ncbi:Hypothetical cytosolic protein [Bifidobacterium animalis subsp. lactis CNCM I-2494]|uniref:Hypothetical cytosolic protein n=1 Tax=Bifidobacterium animalis subsp. lactis CNCM I-2494 TaxID=1042403 RepID=A0A806FT58_BIFAN|nr:Hypothetical cytosolic protein [Bifidobacterium animalis subsp. lactis CNCM I-2494]AXM93202.1 hypothetical protein CJD49_02415 [Bifidobacterium animalis subsp. lactis]
MHGNIRKTDHGDTDLRHSLRKHPQIRPQRHPFTAWFTETSENHATAALIYGTAYGTIRKICRLRTHLQTTPRNLPKTRPSPRLSAAPLTEASAIQTANTSAERLRIPVGPAHSRQCGNRGNKVGPYACSETANRCNPYAPRGKRGGPMRLKIHTVDI